MRSRPDPVSGTTSIRPSAASTEDSPRSAPLPVVHNGVFHEDVRRSIDLPCNHAWSLLLATGVVRFWCCGDRVGARVTACRRDAALDPNVEGRAGDA